ncbi:MAG TPA: DUF3187 family protein [Woeseiaceae bacterium]
MMLPGRNQGRRRGFTALLLGIATLAAASSCLAADHWFPLRNQNPFVNIFGVPAFEGASVAGKGVSRYRVGFDVANHADIGEIGSESIVIDGESYFLELAFKRGISERLELGLAVPVVSHRGGILDEAIYRWHDWLGLSNTKRERPSNELLFSYDNQSNIDFSLASSGTGIGDIRITAGYALASAKGLDGIDLAIRSTLKLPTGDPDQLRGSGATDAALSLHASKNGFFGRDSLSVAGLIGVLWTGDSDFFKPIQKGTVPIVGGAASWRVKDRVEILGHLYAQGYFYDSVLDELSGKSIQLGLGANYRLKNNKLLLSIGFIEDVVGDTTPDFALHFSLRSL